MTNRTSDEFDSENFGNVDPEEYARRRNKKNRASDDGRTRMQTLLHRRLHSWDWMRIEPPGETKAILYVRSTNMGEGIVNLGLAASGDAQVFTIYGGFDSTSGAPTRVKQSPDKSQDDGFTDDYRLTLKQHLHGAWDRVHLIFADENDARAEGTPVDIFISRAWHRKIALAVLARPEVLLRRTEAAG